MSEYKSYEKPLIVLCGGGSAGHITPNLALVEPLREAGYDVCYMGQKQEMEKELAEKAGLDFYAIRAGRLNRFFTLKTLKTPFRDTKGFFQARKHFKALKPACVFAKGGFVSVPAVMAAHSLKLPVVLHESDYTPGLANKVCARYANRVCVNFEETLEYFKKGKAVCTGSPIRSSLMGGDAESGRALAGFTDDKPIVLVMGGSLGSLKINNALRDNLDTLLTKYQILHLCGKGKLSEAHENIPGYKQLEFAGAELRDYYAMSSLMVSRAGANALAEILMLGMPALLIPYDSGSRGDQPLNAASFERRGFSRVLDEAALSAETLERELDALAAHAAEYRAAMGPFMGTAGTQAVVDQIKLFAREK